MLDSSLEKALWECDFFPWSMFHSGHWAGVYLPGTVSYINKDLSFIISWTKKKKKNVSSYRETQSLPEHFPGAGLGSLHWWEESIGQELGVCGNNPGEHS